MNREAREYNETVIPNSAQIERLRSAFPEYFDAQGSFMLDRFEEMLKEDDLNLTREGYELKFLGKSYAKYLAGLETETVVVPDLEHNAEPENKDSENLYIIGDNLDALQHLVKSYAGKIKCIYIDPPYNTGSDGFVYNDDFGFTAQQLIDRIGISEDEARRILDMQGKSSHSAWLTFMYPRLVLARELLSDDGVIFISIDQNEYANLINLTSELFGESNSLATFIWQKKKGGGNDSVFVAVEHEYVAMLTRNADELSHLFVPYSEDYLARYKETDEIGRFFWDTFRRSSGKQYYPIIAPDGTVLENDEQGNPISWLRSESTFKKNLLDGDARFVQKEDGSWSVHFKQRLPQGKKPRSILRDVGTTSTGSDDANGYFGINIFDNPKPVELIKKLISVVAEKHDIVLDFFSGSGTTAEAVMSLNSVDSGARRYLLVQLPEIIDSGKITLAARNAMTLGYQTIDEIGRERIKRAAAKIKEETGADIDYGFKLVRLESPSVKTLDELDAFNPNTDSLLAGDYVSKFDLDGTPGHDVVLTTWMNQDGFGLLAKPRKVELAGYVLDVCEDSAYIINPGIKSADVQELVRLLETNELQLNRVVVFPYSVTFSVMHELKNNLSVLKSEQKVKVIERF
ncbi:site-specific DNA-methyltransferase [Varibaculum massiliense]|uniref:site-specific DNA-methyltransferase n=1 Tax=Varibaculum massiliense TaxID=1852372 RepID=UPI00288C5229|nr:DNA methyltransferase [Varibaculum massiliense]